MSWLARRILWQLFCRENSADVICKVSNFFFDNVPYHDVVHVQIIMNQSISHSRDETPGNLSILVAKLLRNVLGGFANDLKTANNRALERLVCEELLPGQSLSSSP